MVRSSAPIGMTEEREFARERTVLVVGAAGFIGRALVRTLEDAGAAVAVHARSDAQLDRLFPDHRRCVLDLADAQEAKDWRGALAGIDTVVYAAGIMGERSGDRYETVHVGAAKALFEAAAENGVRRVILISATGVETRGLPYATTKRAAECHLERLGASGRLADWAVVRPSVVLGRGGGSDRLFRALAALPAGIRIGGDPGVLRPIAVEDLAQLIAGLALHPDPIRATFDAGGPDCFRVDEIVDRYRAHLGLPPHPTVTLPFGMLRLAATVTMILGAPPPLHPEPVALLAAAPAIDPAPLNELTGIHPASLAEVLRRDPAVPDDLGTAREAFLGILARLSLGVLWLLSGLLPLLGLARPDGYELLASIGITGLLASILLYGSATLDVAIGIAVLRNWRPWLTGLAQLLLIGTFTAIITALAPAWWLDPIGPVLKNVPIVVLVLFVMAREGR